MENFKAAVLKAVEDKNWYAALFLALCLPDICAALERPNVQVGSRYKNWFNRYLGDKYDSGRRVNFTAEDCYKFRCKCLHQGSANFNDNLNDKIWFIPPDPFHNIFHMNIFRNRHQSVLQMQIDIFCKDVVAAVEKWQEDVVENPIVQQRMSELILIHN